MGRQPINFTRCESATDFPVEQGWLGTSGLAAADRIVISGAQLRPRGCDSNGSACVSPEQVEVLVTQPIENVSTEGLTQRCMPQACVRRHKFSRQIDRSLSSIGINAS